MPQFPVKAGPQVASIGESLLETEFGSFLSTNPLHPVDLRAFPTHSIQCGNIQFRSVDRLRALD